MTHEYIWILDFFLLFIFFFVNIWYAYTGLHQFSIAVWNFCDLKN